jgi:NADH-quinone oxidoreductase subunit H
MTEGLHTVSDWVFWLCDSPPVKWAFLILALVMPLASLLTWAERRQSAMMQDRLGPNRANIGPIKLMGILHFVADAIKMIGKEDFVPEKAHKGLFALAPVISIVPVFIAFAIIPFAPTLYPNEFWNVIGANPDTTHAVHPQVFNIEYGLIFYFAILTLANYGATIAGWASYNKWALLGGLRASSQMMSYEVSMGLSLMGCFLLMGTLEPGAMVSMQGWDVLSWGVVLQPVAFVLFFTAAIAETKRGPFDLPEGEPEIIGYFVEYSGMRWGIFFLAEFVEIVFISAVMTSVFFGGYHLPGLADDGFRAFGGYLELPHGAVWALRFLAFGGKIVFFCFLQLAIRWTLPRFRPDQLMNLGWKWLLPLALINTLVTAFFATVSVTWLLYFNLGLVFILIFMVLRK